MLKCRGYNSDGQIGDGTLDDGTRPGDVMGLSYTPTFMTGGQFHNCTLMDYGGVKCWGRADYGEFGNGGDVDSPVPVDAIITCL